MELIFSLKNIRQAAEALLEFTGKEGVLAFYGPMGVGKTTFIKELCRVLGVEDTVNSPSFALVNEYQTAAGTPVYHFDFYRIKNIAEAVDMGAEEYFYTPSALCLIEWPERIEPMLPENTFHINLEEIPFGDRKISI
ncbi:MAG: tRNA (adenosine(37)-N6)-threonylcarbamoyltransferase complex ATPase subunit type 1 TsaE [Bacteroidales bacterium]|jgi:tRNA threonylcarbamoyladenosine biosynthesis protein TsaE|nr:tRNA (adenosine(37)-N6)-threonylcarbamoyltransferase complex ATPase subunit type 1 TsaE [Bacteroidales bacterium]